MRPGKIAHCSCAALQNLGTKYSLQLTPLRCPLMSLPFSSCPLGKALARRTRPRIPTHGDVHPSLDESTSTRAQGLWHRPWARALYGPLVRALGPRRMEADPVDSRRHIPVGTLHPVHVMINSDHPPSDPPDPCDMKPLPLLLVLSPPSLALCPREGHVLAVHQERQILTIVSQAHAVYNARRGRHRNGPPPLC